ncbi:MAG: LbtU family siderophore porin [Desulfobacterales bacterium]
MKKMYNFFLLPVTFIGLICFFYPAAAGELAEKQEVRQRQDEFEESAEGKEYLGERPIGLISSVDQVVLSGFVEFNYDYVDASDTADEKSDSTSDLYLSSVEFALRVFFNEWAKAKFVANAEDIGKDNTENQISLDEAIVTLKLPQAPVYFSGGKAELPFGVFEDHMISGTLTEDLYEVNDVGITLGFAPVFYGLDMSLTIYEGQNIIENLEDFGTHEFDPGRRKEDDVKSFIASVILNPVEDTLHLAAFYASEPGDGNRNRSAGSALTITLWKFTLDAEYITALEREKGADGEENMENAWFAALAFQPLEDLVMAARYEGFNDDRSGDQDETVDYRYLAGFNYSFSDFATFSFEYRHSRFEKETGSNAANDQNEFKCQLALEF